MPRACGLVFFHSLLVGQTVPVRTDRLHIADLPRTQGDRQARQRTRTHEIVPYILQEKLCRESCHENLLAEVELEHCNRVRTKWNRLRCQPSNQSEMPWTLNGDHDDDESDRFAGTCKIVDLYPESSGTETVSEDDSPQNGRTTRKQHRNRNPPPLSEADTDDEVEEAVFRSLGAEHPKTKLYFRRKKEKRIERERQRELLRLRHGDRRGRRSRVVSGESVRPLFSDGDPQTYPELTDKMREADEGPEGKLRSVWLPKLGLLEIGFPKGYKLFETRRHVGTHVDAYLYGHPSGRRYRSPAEFEPHLRWLVEGKPTVPCPCQFCKGQPLSEDRAAELVAIVEKNFGASFDHDSIHAHYLQPRDDSPPLNGHNAAEEISRVPSAESSETNSVGKGVQSMIDDEADGGKGAIRSSTVTSVKVEVTAESNGRFVDEVFEYQTIEEDADSLSSPDRAISAKRKASDSDSDEDFPFRKVSKLSHSGSASDAEIVEVNGSEDGLRDNGDGEVDTGWNQSDNDDDGWITDDDEMEMKTDIEENDDVDVNDDDGAEAAWRSSDGIGAGWTTDDKPTRGGWDIEDDDPGQCCSYKMEPDPNGMEPDLDSSEDEDAGIAYEPRCGELVWCLSDLLDLNPPPRGTEMPDYWPCLVVAERVIAQAFPIIAKRQGKRVRTNSGEGAWVVPLPVSSVQDARNVAANGNIHTSSIPSFGLREPSYVEYAQIKKTEERRDRRGSVASSTVSVPTIAPFFARNPFEDFPDLPELKNSRGHVALYAAVIQAVGIAASYEGYTHQQIFDDKFSFLEEDGLLSSPSLPPASIDSDVSVTSTISVEDDPAPTTPYQRLWAARLGPEIVHPDDVLYVAHRATETTQPECLLKILSIYQDRATRKIWFLGRALLADSDDEDGSDDDEKGSEGRFAPSELHDEGMEHGHEHDPELEYLAQAIVDAEDDDDDGEWSEDEEMARKVLEARTGDFGVVGGEMGVADGEEVEDEEEEEEEDGMMIDEVIEARIRELRRAVGDGGSGDEGDMEADDAGRRDRDADSSDASDSEDGKGGHLASSSPARVDKSSTPSPTRRTTSSTTPAKRSTPNNHSSSLKASQDAEAEEGSPSPTVTVFYRVNSDHVICRAVPQFRIVERLKAVREEVGAWRGWVRAGDVGGV
ncbi:uncharacterized protein EV422DRAFT_617282 [Fimicolochytrium jonesii]|uniref:uncharacterized protein n=1 Tax=Fimicolochytrium jonesii TaxID=1396493 RepID=UPI0022FF3C76|nr:uncharacterized protein EV422DRAFT_617282 [Fimicolochytrium jonesii]KAI8824804.1 hypothetical protein EV422DRAFT_617282 [Fimicolochytrium jonesii]